MRTATRFEVAFVEEMEHTPMNLRDHMMSHPGQCTMAESHVPLTVDMLSDAMLREEVTVYHVGQDAGGRSKSHVYVRDSIHVATFVEIVHIRCEEVSPRPISENEAVNARVGVLH